MDTTAQAARVRWARWIVAATAGVLVAGRLAALGQGDQAALVLVALVAAGGLSAYLLRDRVLAGLGPRHLLDLSLPFSALLFLVLAVRISVGLPDELRLLTDPLLAASLTLSWLGAEGIGGAEPGTPSSPGAQRGRPRLASDAVPLVAGGLAWLASVPGLGLVPGPAFLLLVLASLVAWRLVWPLADPVHPGASPLAPYLPWRQVPGRAWPAWHRVPLRAPATLGYLLASWALFLWLGEPGIKGWWGLDTVRYEAFLYEIPDLSRAPLEALASLGTAPFLNHDHVQLIYVTFLLGLFGLPFEVREGTGRAAVVFAVTGLVGALVAGIALHGLVAIWPDVGFIEHAWERTWSGGSVGAFGLMGALAARARRPAPVFGFFVFWELNVGVWELRSYTPAFHLTALVTGFLLARAWMGPAR